MFLAVWMTAASALLLGWYGLLYIGLPRFCGRVRFDEPDDLLYHLLLAALLLDVGLQVGGWTYAGIGMLIILIVWGALQFRAHWLPYLRGASMQDVQRYYRAFGDNLYLFRHTGDRILPDAYHTVMHFLMVVTFAASLLQVLGVGSR